MCGIAGLLDLDARTSLDALHALAADMAEVVAHRGPDDRGTWADAAAGVAFGHRRLAIIDLSASGHQPMTSADGRWTITYNGELYNFASLRRQLETEGAAFRGHADTEVLVEAIAAWGLDGALAKANGMFALAAWDGREAELHLVRDRLGEKPLFWARAGRTVLFASELQALRRHPDFDDTIDRDALAGYFSLGRVAGPRTIYERAGSLPPGSILTLARAHPEPRMRRYWSLDDVARQPVRPIDDADAVVELHDLLVDAVSLRAHADVPLGAFLSGGVDSSTIVALLAASGRSVQTFTIGFDERRMDESAAARSVAAHLGTDHHEVEVGADVALAGVERLGAVYDEPHGDPSSLPTLLVSEAARTRMTVALTGDGGDEVFAGYNRHVLGEAFWRRAAPVPPRLRSLVGIGAGAVPHGWARRMGTPAEGLVRNPADKLARLAAILPASDVDDLARRLLAIWPDGSDLVVRGRAASSFPELPRDGSVAERLAYLDTLTTLPDDMLVKVDRASMHVALEVRVPLLDHRVVEWVWGHPFDLRLRHGTGKWILREVLARYVPRELTERPKMGFDPPLGAWLRGPLLSWAEDLLAPRRLLADGYLRPEPIARAWREHLSGRHNHEYRLWSVLAFQSWLDHRHYR